MEGEGTIEMTIGLGVGVATRGTTGWLVLMECTWAVEGSTAGAQAVRIRTNTNTALIRIFTSRSNKILGGRLGASEPS